MRYRIATYYNHITCCFADQSVKIKYNFSACLCSVIKIQLIRGGYLAVQIIPEISEHIVGWKIVLYKLKAPTFNFTYKVCQKLFHFRMRRIKIFKRSSFCTCMHTPIGMLFFKLFIVERPEPNSGLNSEFFKFFCDCRHIGKFIFRSPRSAGAPYLPTFINNHIRSVFTFLG